MAENADCHPATGLEHVHDVRLVWALEAPHRADRGGHPGELADCAGRVLLPGARQPDGRFTGYQLKIIQECITILVFVVFAYFYLREPIRWNYALSFVCIVGAVLFAFWGRG